MNVQNLVTALQNLDPEFEVWCSDDGDEKPLTQIVIDGEGKTRKVAFLLPDNPYGQHKFYLPTADETRKHLSRQMQDIIRFLKMSINQRKREQDVN